MGASLARLAVFPLVAGEVDVLAVSALRARGARGRRTCWRSGFADASSASCFAGADSGAGSRGLTAAG